MTPPHKEVSHALAPALAADVPVLEIDRLDVYRVTLEFQRLAGEVTGHLPGEVRSQLERANWRPQTPRPGSLTPQPPTPTVTACGPHR